VLEIGLVGFGRWGRNYLAAVEASGRAKITSVLLPRNSNNADEARRSGLHVATELDSFRVDAVVIATHPSLAPEFCSHFLTREIPVMVEKPAALTLEGADIIFAAAYRPNSLVLVSHQHLFSNSYEYIRQNLHGQAVNHILSRAGGLGPHRAYSALWDYGPHDLAMIFGITDLDPISINAIHHTSPNGDYFSIDLKFIPDTQVKCEIWNDGLPKTRYFKVVSGDDEFIYDDLDLEGRLRRNGKILKHSYEPPLTRAVSSFVEAVIEGGTDDYRYGAEWAVRMANWLNRIENFSSKN